MYAMADYIHRASSRKTFRKITRRKTMRNIFFFD